MTQVARQPVADVLLKHVAALQMSISRSRPVKVQLQGRTKDRISLKTVYAVHTYHDVDFHSARIYAHAETAERALLQHISCVKVSESLTWGTCMQVRTCVRAMNVGRTFCHLLKLLRSPMINRDVSDVLSHELMSFC